MKGLFNSSKIVKKRFLTLDDLIDGNDYILTVRDTSGEIKSGVVKASIVPPKYVSRSVVFVESQPKVGDLPIGYVPEIISIEEK